MRGAARVGFGVAIAAVLALVFAWYLQPEVVMALATQVWTCF